MCAVVMMMIIVLVKRAVCSAITDLSSPVNVAVSHRSLHDSPALTAQIRDNAPLPSGLTLALAN
jgi:hypothetical protein